MPTPKLTTWQLIAGSTALGLVIATGAVALAGPWDSGQRKAERDRAASRAPGGGAHHQAPARVKAPAPAPSAPGVLAVLGAPGNVPAGKSLSAVLDPLLSDPALGSVRTAAVIDTATGRQLYGSGADRPMTPASTVKLATTTAALSALGPDHRIATTVRASADGKHLTLVGGGDPTLSKDRLRALADDTVRVLRDRGVTSVSLSYDISLYSGPQIHPIGINDNIAPVVALMTDEGRVDGSDHGPAPRTGDPAGDTARTFAGMLKDRGVTADTDSAPAGAPAGSTPIARTNSDPLSALVERALTNSDNDLAEALARQTALAAGEPASFEGAGRAVKAELAKLQLPVEDAQFADGSGLDRNDRVTASLLARVLARAADPASPRLRPVLTGLPIAGFSGTLADRYTGSASGTGLVRAKTGTLTGVNTLAGTVVAADGRLLSFAFLASDTASPYTAQPALDRLATALATRKLS
ncbi:D-alanyl-D-alanine carboxypeptidase/D-alanyl-D-alanine endopeptidase [Streptomyces sp. NBC_01465]|uniref:D-alanyl-D-alanine carboxypeptidase/D-alanyl-D-alanine endopeptidase n=1 Tax=Streptomyces sp. NBC_01465 TaxID=2903878 RepID=UPI002E3273E3|nr:D-alanyl-D-alanine carboxypeptidase/D-alanyl-D-alanine-endopeptidase [Streptomyces sp. NBC_01465]